MSACLNRRRGKKILTCNTFNVLTVLLTVGSCSLKQGMSYFHRTRMSVAVIVRHLTSRWFHHIKKHGHRQFRTVMLALNGLHSWWSVFCVVRTTL